MKILLLFFFLVISLLALSCTQSNKENTFTVSDTTNGVESSLVTLKDTDTVKYVQDTLDSSVDNLDSLKKEIFDDSLNNNDSLANDDSLVDIVVPQDDSNSFDKVSDAYFYDNRIFYFSMLDSIASKDFSICKIQLKGSYGQIYLNGSEVIISNSEYVIADSLVMDADKRFVITSQDIDGTYKWSAPTIHIDSIIYKIYDADTALIEQNLIIIHMQDQYRTGAILADPGILDDFENTTNIFGPTVILNSNIQSAFYLVNSFYYNKYDNLYYSHTYGNWFACSYENEEWKLNNNEEKFLTSKFENEGGNSFLHIKMMKNDNFIVNDNIIMAPKYAGVGVWFSQEESTINFDDVLGISFRAKGKGNLSVILENANSDLTVNIELESSWKKYYLEPSNGTKFNNLDSKRLIFTNQTEFSNDTLNFYLDDLQIEKIPYEYGSSLGFTYLKFK